MEDLKANIRSVIRRHGPVAAYAVMGVSAGVILMTALLPMFMGPTSIENAGDPSATTTLGAHAYTLAESEPMRLRIPEINVDAPFTSPLGLSENREVEVPKGYDEVGWYKYGPTPGELGPSVILGHVDSIDGAAVFYLLGQLEPGDEVYVDREDGSTATFVVTALERVDQSEFPTQRVYGNIDHAGLRLVTCTGVYDHEELRYSHNLIVYAALKEPGDAATTTPSE